MKTFDVFRRPGNKGGTRGRTTFWGTREIEVVKKGFSWPGFFFNVWWALAKRLYAQAAILALVYFVVVAADNALVGFVAIVAAIFAGVQGNTWRRSELSRHGFQLEESIEADTDGQALARYLVDRRSAPVTQG